MVTPIWAFLGACERNIGIGGWRYEAKIDRLKGLSYG